MKNLIRPVFVILSILLLVSASSARPVRIDNSSDAEFVRFLEDAWVNAIVHKNVDVLYRIMADDFTGVSPNGARYTKAEAIADIQSGFYKVELMELEKVNVSLYGNMALVTFYQNEKSRFGDEDSSGRFAFTDVWLNRNGKWEVISSHGTPVVLP
jgi:ketosteroid isomerase-like protein